jgi:hypothetical protein
VGLVWITGNSGTGKSTVRTELASRGHPSFDTDEDGIAVWRSRTTGEQVCYLGVKDHPETWRHDHGWVMNRGRVEALAILARDRAQKACGRPTPPL